MEFRERLPAHLSMEGTDVQRAVRDVRRAEKRREFAFEKRGSRYCAPPEKFDPNTYVLEDWMALGLSEKQSAIILKFSKYGLKSNDDLKKIFVISDELFALIKDSTFYPERAFNNTEFVSEREKPSDMKVRKVDLNAATEEDLLSVKGIGPFFARQILKRRDELGGFIHKDQLLEVWKMDAEKVASLESFLTIDPAAVKKININTATAAEMKRHPYFSWNLANSLVKLRAQKGLYKTIEEAKKSVLMTEDLFEKLAPYLSVE